MNKRGYLLVIAGAMLWGTTGTSQALAPQGAQPLAIGALRILLGGLFLLIIQLATRSRLVITRQNLRPILLAAFCMAAYQVLFFAGVKMTGVAVGTIVGIGSSPIFAGLLGFFFRGERPGWRWGLATLLAIAGCVLLAFTGEEVHADPLGMLLAIGAGAVYATFSLASKEVLEEQPVQTVMAAVFCLGALLLAPLLLTQDLRWLAQPRGIAVALHLGLLTVALAYLLFGKGLRLVPLATAGTLTLAEPLTAGTLGVLVLGEKLTPLAGLGILLIFSGLVVLALPKKFELKVQERDIPRS